MDMKHISLDLTRDQLVALSDLLITGSSGVDGLEEYRQAFEDIYVSITLQADATA